MKLKEDDTFKWESNIHDLENLTWLIYLYKKEFHEVIFGDQKVFYTFDFNSSTLAIKTYDNNHIIKTETDLNCHDFVFCYYPFYI